MTRDEFDAMHDFLVRLEMRDQQRVFNDAFRSVTREEKQAELDRILDGASIDLWRGQEVILP